MKKGFTLIELLAVIIILAVIALIATPIVLNVVNNAQDSARKSSVAGFADATKLAITEYQFKEQGSVPTVDNAFISTITYQGEKIVCGQDSETPGVYYSTSYGIVLHGCKVGDNDTLYYFGSGKVYTDKNDETYKKIFDNVKGNPVEPAKPVANAPELDNGLVPVIYNGTNWKVADTKTKWYDYDNKEWANAIIVKTGVKANYVKDKVVVEDDVLGYFVWIPRYEYTVNAKEQAITIDFVSNIAAKNDKTHPAFTFGTTELNGLWVAKFEVSTEKTNICYTSASAANCNNTNQNPRVLPNVSSLRYQNVSNQFTTAQKFTTYGLTNSDSHIMKNTEWGAVAYLTQSIYGRCESMTVCTKVSVNNSSTFITGSSAGRPGDSTTETSTVYAYNTPQGFLANTTGNIYGIYDMNGGSFDYVMGNYNNAIASSGFSTMPATKYYDLYKTTTGIKGDATNADGTNGWYGEVEAFISSSFPWFIRGGFFRNDGGGIFSFNGHNGNVADTFSFRPVITRP